MRDDNYYVVLGWMVNNLNLKGMEKDAFAILYGLSQDDGESHCSLSCISSSIGCSKSTAQKLIKQLEDKNFIKKRVEMKNGVSFNNYSILVDQYDVYDPDTNRVYRKSVPHTEKDMGVYRNSVGGVPKIGTNNIVDNTIDNKPEKKDISSTIVPDISKEKSTKNRSSGVNPSKEEVEAYIKKKGYHFTAESIIKYYTNDGELDKWKMKDGTIIKDWHRCCVTFEGNYLKRNAGSSPKDGISPAPADTYHRNTRWDNDPEMIKAREFMKQLEQERLKREREAQERNGLAVNQ